MIKIENTEVMGWEPALRGMRNPMNSWKNSDSYWTHIENPETLNTAKFEFFIGENDLRLAKKLAKAGAEHRKYMRMINVYCDITAPLYWWKEFDTYKIGTVANSCSTMHKIHEKAFCESMFSTEHLDELGIFTLKRVLFNLNQARHKYKTSNSKDDWWEMIQLLPTSYNQRRTVMVNYETLSNIHKQRRNHKLDEWHTFCDWIESLPYSELLTDRGLQEKVSKIKTVTIPKVNADEETV